MIRNRNVYKNMYTVPVFIGECKGFPKLASECISPLLNTPQPPDLSVTVMCRDWFDYITYHDFGLMTS